MSSKAAPFPNTPWATAIANTPRPSEPGVYDVNIARDWSIASLPLGGYLASLLTAVVRTHFALHHPAPPQPDPITSHCTFVSRAASGPGVVRVTVAKRGRQYSNVLARLYQRAALKDTAATAAATAEGEEVLVVEALVTQGNLARERDAGGISLPIANPLSSAQIFRRETGVEFVDPPHLVPFLSAATKLRRIFPAGTVYEGNWSHPVHGPSVREEWISWDRARSGVAGGGFDAQAMAMLMDNFRPPAYNFDGLDINRNWMATLSITTDVKKAPPVGSEGWEWLFLRVVVGKCNFGRYSMDILLLDESGDVVATGRRTELVLGQERRAGNGGEKSRI